MVIKNIHTVGPGCKGNDRGVAGEVGAGACNVFPGGKARNAINKGPKPKASDLFIFVVETKRFELSFL
jgi:hypothetical protein